MPIIKKNEAEFYQDFLPLITEVICGPEYNAANPQHVQWLRNRIATYFMGGGQAYCLYGDAGRPMGFFLVVHDLGPEGVKRFSKKATIMLFGLFHADRGKGHGKQLLEAALEEVKEHGGECIYANTYSKNARVINFFTKNGFIPAAYHPGENGIEDEGQIYLYNEIV